MDFLTSNDWLEQSYPEIDALPDVGEINVQSILIVVVFPAPFGPRKPKIVPSSTSKETLSIAVIFPNCLESLSTSIIGICEFNRITAKNRGPATTYPGKRVFLLKILLYFTVNICNNRDSSRKGYKIMTKFANREEYEAWKDGKIIESQYSPEGIHTQTSEVSSQSNAGRIIGLIVFVVAVMAGAYTYLENYQAKVVWIENSYTNTSLGFSIELPEGWEKFEYRPELKKQVESYTPPGAKSLFMISPNNSENTVYELLDMQKVIPPDQKNVDNIVEAELKKLDSMLTSMGFETSPFTMSIDGLDARFLQANLASSVIVAGIIVKPQERTLLFQFYDLMGTGTQAFWRSARSLSFIDEE